VLEDLGVVDLRQDLADYVADATALSLRAQQREAQALVLAIKVAKQDADTLALARLARRLKLIAPDHAILDLLADNASLAPSKTFAELLLTNVELLLPGRAGRGRGAPPWRRLPQLALVATLVLLCGFALGHHAALSDAASSGRPLSRLTLPLPPEQPAPPVTAPPLSAQMEVEVVTMPGDAAVVTIDGYVVAGDEVHQEALNPGRHLLEVRAPHVRFRRYIAVSAGERLRLVADCVHRLLMVR
jgi:hypothetical protein